MFRKENGVTLVALVVTIIVLLILAGVTISMVLGDDSILGHAQTASETYPFEDVKSAIALAVTTANTNALANQYDNDASTTAEAVDIDDIKNAYNAMDKDAKVTFSGSTATFTHADKTLTATFTFPAEGKLTATVAFDTPQ